MGFIFFFSTTPCGVDRNGDEYIFNPTKSRSLDFFVEKQEWRKTTTLQPIIFICLVHASFLRVAILKILYLPCHA